jgi:hypothetical protein
MLKLFFVENIIIWPNIMESVLTCGYEIWIMKANCEQKLLAIKMN